MGDAELEMTALGMMHQSGGGGRVDVGEVKAVLALCRRKSYTRGEIVQANHGETDSIAMLAHGALRLHIPSADGREFTLHYLRCPGDVFELGRVDPRVGEEVVARVETDAAVVYLLSWSRLVTELTLHPAGAAPVLMLLYQRARVERALLCDQALHSAPTRIKHVLQREAVRDGDRIVTRTLDELGSMARTTPTEVSRVVSELIREGVVTRQARRRIYVSEPDRLD